LITNGPPCTGGERCTGIETQKRRKKTKKTEEVKRIKRCRKEARQKSKRQLGSGPCSQRLYETKSSEER